MHLADVRGWLRESGLSVEVQDGRGSGNTLQLVNAGQADVGQIQVGLIAQAREQGATVRSFAGFGRRTDLSVLVDRDSPIRRVQDFRGRSLILLCHLALATPYVGHGESDGRGRGPSAW
jgi:NitT/TauT family transport system substrate-binding protein